jgi:DNA-binding response OmpR family regulator
MADRALIVDDNPEVVATTRWMLETSGFVVETAASGREALAALRARLPTVVLLDVMMPEMSGFEVLRTIRSEPPTAKLPVILVTARSADRDVLTGYQMDADYYLAKPYSRDDLVYAIRLVLGKLSPTEITGKVGKDRTGS